MTSINHIDKLRKSLVIRFFLNDDILKRIGFEKIDEWVKGYSLFSDDELKRCLVFNHDGDLYRGNTGTKKITDRAKQLYDENSLSTYRLMDDESLDDDDQNKVELYISEWDDDFKSTVTFLVSDINKYENAFSFFKAFSNEFQPIYGYGNIYIYDNLYELDSNLTIDSLNKSFPIDNMNFNRYESSLKKGMLKDIQWLNYFNGDYFNDIVISGEKDVYSMEKNGDTRIVRISEHPLFDEQCLKWINEFRRVNKSNLIFE